MRAEASTAGPSSIGPHTKAVSDVRDTKWLLKSAIAGKVAWMAWFTGPMSVHYTAHIDCCKWEAGTREACI